MDQRDSKDLNPHVKIHFEEVLGEPEGVRSLDGVWKVSYLCFNGTLNCCYKALTVFCAVPLACCWGCKFACLACTNIWCLTPCYRACSIQLAHCRRLLTLIMDSCCGPCCETCGLCLSKIQVKNSS
jgi:hypothetical protein